MPDLPNNVRPIRAVASPPDTSIVSFLESLLAEARNGDIIGLAGVVEYRARWRDFAVGRAIGNDRYLGWLEVLKTELAHAFLAPRDPHDRGDSE